MNLRRLRRRLRDGLQKLTRFDMTSLNMGSRFRRWQRKRRDAAAAKSPVIAADAASAATGKPIEALPATRKLGLGARLRQTLIGRIISWPFTTWGAVLRWFHVRLVKQGFKNATARVIVLFCATVLLLAAAGGFGWFAKGILAEQRIRSLLSAAREQEKNNRIEQSVAGYYMVLRSRPNNIEAHERLAEISLKARAGREAVLHRKRLAELFPDDLQRKLNWAEAALAFNQPGAVSEALASVPETQRKDVRYLRVRAAADAAAGRTSDVESTLKALLAVKPDDAASAVRLAALQLGRTQEREAQKALRETLEPYLDNPAVALEAGRALSPSYLRAGEGNAALRAARVAAAHPNARLSDALLLINTLQAVAPTLVDPELAALKERASTNPLEAFEVARWILARGRYAEADQWLMALKPEVRESPVLLVVRADAAMAQGQWERLDALTANPDGWGELETQRLAFSARAARELGQPPVGRTRWGAAVRAAGESLPQLRQLRQIATVWNWADERVEVEWQLVKYDTISGRELLGKLYEHYRDRLDGPGLRRVFEKIVELNPEDSKATRNLALLYLMARIQVPRAHELAMAAHIRAPDDLDSLVAYAYAVHVKGETEEALRLLEPQAEEIAKSAYLGGYYGLILCAKGRNAEARPLLREALTSALLPEESALMRAELEKP